MLILGITSSTARVGVALGAATDGVVEMLAEATSSTDRRHAEEVTPLLVEVLETAGIDIASVDRLAVDVGPGRFTGLRVGLATIRSLALALDLAVVGVSSLELLAVAQLAATPSSPRSRLVVAVIDARRNEVFQQVFDDDGALGLPTVGPPADLAILVPVDAVVVGDGADRYAEHYGAGVVSGREPSPSWLVRLAAVRPSAPAAAVAPCYLRDPDVQINIRTRTT